MQLLVTSCLFFAVFYFTLRYLKISWEKNQLPSWSRPILGMFAWGVVLSFGGILVGLTEPIYVLFTEPNMGGGFLLVAIALGISAVAKYAVANPEFFDFPAMKPFLKDSLAFSDPARKRANLFEELDRHEVRRVYKEVTGNDLPGDDMVYDRQLKRKLDASTGRDWREDGVVRQSEEVRKVLVQPIASPHLHVELQELGKGKTTDLIDSWRINTLKKAPHDFFPMIAAAEIALPDRRLHFRIESEQFTRRRAMEATALYRLKQDLYEFLQAANQVSWMEPYLKFVDVIECTCVQLEVDAFSGIARTPLLEVEITRRELNAQADKFFNAGELKTTILL